MKVALIIGHSERAQGAVNDNTGTTEYDYNSRMVPMISRFLNDVGIYNIIVHRDTYQRLPDDVNATGVDIALEFHANSTMNKSVSGTEVLYWGTSREGKKLAESVQRQMVDCLNLNDRGAKPIHEKDRGGYLLRKTAMPCVIVEPFFISNDDDLKHAEAEMTRLAQSIVVGIYNYHVE